MHSLGVCLPQSPVIQVLTSLAKSYQLSPKPHKLLETITFTVILNHQARSTELIEKLDSDVTEMNYMALNELLGFPGGSDGKNLSAVQET